MYKDVQDLNPTDAAYIAGLIDGEGTVTLSRRHRNENRHLVISISNTERRLLEYVLDTVGAGKITCKKISRPHHTASYTYTLSNRQGLTLLRQVLPFLKTYKAKRAELILNDYVRLTPRNGRYSPEIKRARDEFENEILSIKS